MFHGNIYLLYKYVSRPRLQYIDLIVSRETLSCVHNPNIGNVSRETLCF